LWDQLRLLLQYVPLSAGLSPLSGKWTVYQVLLRLSAAGVLSMRPAELGLQPDLLASLAVAADFRTVYGARTGSVRADAFDRAA
jgi:hypothetical protein